MADLKFALLLILSIDAVLFLGSAAIHEVNPDGNIMYNCSGSTLGFFGNCNTYDVEQNPKNQLPGGTTSGVDATTGNVYTDSFTSIIEWLFNIPGAGILLKMLAGPVLILHIIPSIPGVFTFTVGTLWFSLTFFLLISFFLGRQGE